MSTFLKSFKKNRIIICVSHDLATHIELSDEILWMENGEIKKIKMLCRIDTNNELEYYKHGGILQYVLRNTI